MPTFRPWQGYSVIVQVSSQSFGMHKLVASFEPPTAKHKAWTPMHGAKEDVMFVMHEDFFETSHQAEDYLSKLTAWNHICRPR